MSSKRLVLPLLFVLTLPNLSRCAETIVRAGHLEIGLDPQTGIPQRIDSQARQSRTWLTMPVSLTVQNVVTRQTAKPVTLPRRPAAYTAALAPLDLTLTHQWTDLAAGLQWQLTFSGEGPRVEHCVVIDLPLLSVSDRVFTPSLRGVMDVAQYPAHRPAQYGHYDWQGAQGYVLPLVSVMDPITDNALTVALSPNDNIPHFQVEWKGNTLRLTLARRGMGGDRPTTLNLLFLTHAADYRAVLKVYSDLFPRYFEPALPRGPYEGAFYYHHIQDHPDYEEMARQHVRFLWSSFWFTHLGEYLPAERQWHPYTYAKWWKLGQIMSDDRINAFIETMYEHDIGTYAYFNVTEYGGYGGKEGNADTAAQRLREMFADALMKTAEGRDIPTWEGAMAMNPGASYSLRPFLREQVQRHLDRIPRFEGFVIDRLDWASRMDYGHSDGLTMIGDHPVENMAVPVSDAVREVCRLSHAAGKRVFVNQFWRLEVMRDTDGACHESDPLPLFGYLTPLRPASAWHHRVPYDGDLFLFEAQLKRRLHWALFPQMIAHAFPISQQRASARAADLLEIYAPLFAPLMGKRQVLAAHCVTVDGANEANLFVNGAGHTVVPVTSRLHFLSRATGHTQSTVVTIATETVRDLSWAHVYSADGPPYRARVSIDGGKASIVLARHVTASIVVAGAAPEPPLQNQGIARIAQARGQLFPQTGKDPDTPLPQRHETFSVTEVKDYVLTVQGEHAGLPDPVQVQVNGRPVGLLSGHRGVLPLPGKDVAAPRVALYTGSEGVWFVPAELNVLAIDTHDRAYRVARWTPDQVCGLDTRQTGHLWVQLTPCDPEACVLPVGKATYVERQVGSGGDWQARLGKTAAWIAQVQQTPSQQGYELHVTGNAYTWQQAAQHDDRVLASPLPPDEQRPATCWYADRGLRFSVTPPDNAPYRLTVYVLDYDRHGRAMEIQPGSAAVQSVPPDQTAKGVYLTWLVQGAVELTLDNKEGQNAVFSGVFIDPQE